MIVGVLEQCAHTVCVAAAADKCMQHNLSQGEQLADLLCRQLCSRASKDAEELSLLVPLPLLLLLLLLV